jgi:hypothetical protein
MQVKPVMLDLNGGLSAGTSNPFAPISASARFSLKIPLQARRCTGLNLVFRESIPKH